MMQNLVYDVILINTELVGMDGRAVTRHIRQLERIKGQQVTPLFGLTRKVSQTALALDNKAGMSGAIEKGAVLAKIIPKVIRLAQKNPDKFFFGSCNNQIDEQVGLARVHVENKVMDQLKLPPLSTPPKRLPVSTPVSVSNSVSLSATFPPAYASPSARLSRFQ